MTSFRRAPNARGRHNLPRGTNAGARAGRAVGDGLRKRAAETGARGSGFRRGGTPREKGGSEWQVGADAFFGRPDPSDAHVDERELAYLPAGREMETAPG